MRVTLGLLAVILTVCSALPVSRKVRYDSYKVYRVIPRTQEELEWMEEVADRWAMLDFWKRPSTVGRPVDVMVSPDQQLSFVSSASRPGLTIETWISNVQDLIDREAVAMVSSKNDFDAAAFDYNNYHTYEEIFAWMNDFASSHLGVSMVQVTTTYEGEAVYGLRIAKSPSATNVAYIQGGIHAREWISPATVINLIKNYIDNYGSDDTVTSMLDNFVWIIVPVFNVDGYKFSISDDRMWRKNRNPNTGGCAGVDLNRNYDYQWGGASNQKCAQDYQGTKALSEPENSGSKDFLQGFGSNLKLFIDFHSYGQYWLYPWGYTRRTVTQPDRDDQKDLAIAIENSITSVHGKDYFVGESGPDMYPATGGSEDFGYGSLGVKYTYVVELRDEGIFGFELPAYQIQPTAEEIFAGMKTLGKQLVAEFA
ncbi:carboxypeptidase B-like [Strongylocentrotus purpuratus]|uniref:Peptidase M14 domain-containing protein n=1 Tax=Strongylocentrotus purpuratus TaxID=7668 RepID=A0A7M7PT24_STRPU|nr:carboxypeptidase B-like [Strongylocentrotus purpuratus]